jgi:hypothetical protein
LDATYNCFRDSAFSGISRILPLIHKDFSKIAKPMTKLLEKTRLLNGQ